jgi:hypothetical protein
MDDYIAKPMRHADITAILRRWIPDQQIAVPDELEHALVP